MPASVVVVLGPVVGVLGLVAPWHVGSSLAVQGGFLTVGDHRGSPRYKYLFLFSVLFFFIDI